MMIVAATALSLAVPALVTPPPAAADWGPVTTLAANTRGESLAVDARGAVTVVWAGTASPGDVIARRRTAGGDWHAPVVIGHGYAPQVVVDRRGDVTALWLTQEPGRTDGVAAARRPAGGHWSDPVEVSRDLPVPGYQPGAEDVYGATQLDVAVGARGVVAAAWAWGSVDRHRPWRVQAVWRHRHGGWADPAAVTPANSSSAPQVGVAADGTTVVAWGRQPFGHPQTLRARRHDGSGWTAPETVAREGYAPELAVDRAGDALLVFHTATDRAAAAAMTAGGAWQPVERLSPAGVDAEDVALAMNAAGAAVVAVGRPGGRVDLVDRPRGGPWGPPVRAVRSRATVYDVLVALDGAGDVFLGWGGYALYGKLRPAGGSWGARTTISPDAGAEVLEATYAAMAPDGAVAVLWKQEERPLKVRTWSE
ncbi:hypothetical protein [Nocardioides aquiterrae]|uniref:Exo-alpha-sialidase n=1 Tax=Nocardioides aquiterrae TaxID=203799 RepID=A0ABN1UGV6_9ACTN